MVNTQGLLFLLLVASVILLSATIRKPNLMFFDIPAIANFNLGIKRIISQLNIEPIIVWSAMQPKEHWEQVYSSKPTNSMSWFQEHADCSLRLIRETGVPASAAIIDVGEGASTLVDDLLSCGFNNVTVLDLSAAALKYAQARLGDKAKNVHWLEADITIVDLPIHSIDVWHDRAVFHFLTSRGERVAYVENVLRSVRHFL